MDRTEALKKVLLIYGRTDCHVSQRFYQSLCIEAIEEIEQLEKRLTELQCTILNAK